MPNIKSKESRTRPGGESATTRSAETYSESGGRGLRLLEKEIFPLGAGRPFSAKHSSDKDELEARGGESLRKGGEGFFEKNEEQHDVGSCMRERRRGG